MKTLNFTILCSLLSILMILTSCNKEMETFDNIDSPVNSQYSALKYLSDLKSQLSKVELEERSTSSKPNNASNYMDSYGEYFGDMFTAVNNDEKLNPSLNAAMYRAKYVSYQAQNPLTISIKKMKAQPSELYSLLFSLINDISFISNSSMSILKLKLIENNIASSKYLTRLEKEHLLAQSAYYKFTLSAVSSAEAIYAYGNVISKTSRAGFWDCFDRAFQSRAEDNFQVLNIENGNPCQCIAAWCGLPVTIAASIGDSIIGAVSDCW